MKCIENGKYSVEKLIEPMITNIYLDDTQLGITIVKPTKGEVIAVYC